jgi:hypothetical protein
MEMTLLWLLLPPPFVALADATPALEEKIQGRIGLRAGEFYRIPG